MSRQIGFRLDPDNLREAQALRVLEQGQAAGYSTRHILTEALLALEVAAKSEQAAEDTLRQMAEELRQMRAELARLRSGVIAVVETPDNGHCDGALSDAFLDSVREAARTGLKLG